MKKGLFTEYWNNRSKLTKPYLKKHWKGVLLLNVVFVTGIVVWQYWGDIKKVVSTKFKKIFIKTERA